MHPHIWFIENLYTAAGIADRWVVVCDSEREALAMRNGELAFRTWTGEDWSFRPCIECRRPTIATLGHTCRHCIMGEVDEREEAERLRMDRLRNKGPAASQELEWILIRESAGFSSYDPGVRVNLTPWPTDGNDQET